MTGLQMAMDLRFRENCGSDSMDEFVPKILLDLSKRRWFITLVSKGLSFRNQVNSYRRHLDSIGALAPSRI